MSKRDYYEVLGLAKNATDEEIKKAYRRLAMKFHPDRNPNNKAAEESFKEAKEAYENLSNPSTRRQYDQYGHAGKQPQFSHGNGPHVWTFTEGMPGDINEIFANIFGMHDGGFGQHRTQQRSVLYPITISLEDAYKGITIKHEAVPNVDINIAAGVRPGTRFYVDGKMFKIDVLPHIKFKRTNDDLLIDIEINAIEAMLGMEALLTHLDSAIIKFTIPPGLQHGQIVKLSGKGMKNPENDKMGDLLVRVAITTPRSLTEEQRDAIKKLDHRVSITI